MSKAERPWMKFYPADWRSDPALRMCSFAARGLWVDLLSLMHEADPYGHLIVSGRIPTSKQLAGLLGGTAREIDKLLHELEQAGVFSRDEAGSIFSRRMLRDRAKLEKDRLNGSGGGNPHLKAEDNQQDNGGVNPRHNGGLKAHMPEARGQIPEKKDSAVAPRFDEFWLAYPSRSGPNPKKPASQRYASAIQHGVDPDLIIGAAKRYADAIRLAKTDLKFVAQAVTWLNQERWNDQPKLPPQTARPMAFEG